MVPPLKHLGREGGGGLGNEPVRCVFLLRKWAALPLLLKYTQQKEKKKKVAVPNSGLFASLPMYSVSVSPQKVAAIRLLVECCP